VPVPRIAAPALPPPPPLKYIFAVGLDVAALLGVAGSERCV